MKKWWSKGLLTILCVGMSFCALSAATGCKWFKKSKDSQSNTVQSSESQSDAEHLHAWDEGTLSENVCGKECKVVYTCSGCDETREEFVLLKHEYTDKTVEATCTEKGYTLHTCKNCGETYRDSYTDMASHDFTSEETKGGCLVNAFTTYTCTNCSYSYQEVSKTADGHNTENCVWTDAGEEHKEGCLYEKKQTAICNDCGETVTRADEIEKHTYVFVENSVAATCVADGKMLYVCSGCGAEAEEDYANAEAHAWALKNTDTTTGVSTYVCEHNREHTKTMFSAKDKVSTNITADVLKEINEIELKEAVIKMDDAVREQLGAEEISLSADTLDSATKETALEKMSESEKEKIGDKPIYDFTLENKSGLVSSFNGKMTITIPYTLSEGEDPANICVWYINGSTVETLQAKYDNGYATFETDHFSYYTVVRLTPEERCALYGHSFWMEKTVAATCTTSGYTLRTCKRCALVESVDETNATGHKYSGVVTAATCEAKGYTTYTCAACKDSYVSDYTDAGAHDYVTTVVAPTCEEKGYTTYTCTICEETYNDSFVKELGHSYKNDVQSPTCTEKGHEQRVCENCGKTHINSDFGEALGHDYQKTVVAATCLEAGYTKFTCSRCQDSYEEDITEKLGHDYEITEGGMDVGYAVYTCKRCSDSYTQSFGEHAWAALYELAEGSTECTDGVTAYRYCTICNIKEKIGDYNVHYKNYSNFEIVTDCGSVKGKVGKCTCGKEQEYIIEEMITVCDFQFVEEEIIESEHANHVRVKGVCSVCGFEVIIEAYEDKLDGCRFYRFYQVDFGDVTVVESSYYYDHGWTTEKSTDEYGNVIEKDHCINCEQDIAMKTLNDNGLVIREERLDTGFVYRYEYEGCNCTSYRVEPFGEIYLSTGEYHVYNTRYELAEGAKTCEDGVWATWYCTLCGEEGEPELYYSHRGTHEALAAFETACGEFTVERYHCACGENDWTSFDNSCNMMSTSTPIMHEDGREGRRYVYTCQDCGFVYWRERYTQKENCIENREEIYYFNVTADGYAYTTTISSSYESHQTKQQRTELEDNFVEYKYVCIDCEKTTDHYKEKLDEYGRTLSHYDFLSAYTTIYEYDGCSYTAKTYDSNGELMSEGWGEGHQIEGWYELMEGSTTCEDGTYWINGCIVCGEEFYRDEHYGSHYVTSQIEEIYTDCGVLEIYTGTCACGEREEVWFGAKDCSFERIDEIWMNDDNSKEGHYIYTYECTSCGYRYTREHYYTLENCQETSYEFYTIGGKEFNGKSVYESHNGRTESGPSAVEGATWYQEVCLDCEKMLHFYESKEDEFGRRVYYKDFMDGTSYTRVYTNNCYYTQENFLNDVYTGTENGQDHGNSIRSGKLKEGSVTCEDGVVVNYNCSACGELLDQYETNGHERFKHIEKTIVTGSPCGNLDVYRWICACGENFGSIQVNGNCDFGETWEWIGEDVDGKKDYERCTVRCAVTECGYTYTLDSYYIAEGCMQHWYYVYRFGVQEDGSYAEEFIYEELRLEHDDYLSDSSEDENGGWIYTYKCENCEMVTRVEQYDQYGRDIYYMDNVHLTGYKRIFNGCDYQFYEYDKSTGEFVYRSDEVWHATQPTNDSCTQFRDGKCIVCDTIVENDYWPILHSYSYDSEKQTYVCWRCGMENVNGSDGSFVMEDLTDENGIKVGYYQRWHSKDLGNIYIVLDYYGEKPVHLANVAFTHEMTGGDVYERSGMITLDMDSLRAEIQAAGVTPTTVNVVIEAYDDQSGTYLDYILTVETW